jgi:type IV pilus assembly protein PilW
MCAESTRTQRGSSVFAQRGLSLIELLVGIAVASLVGVAALGTAVFFNAAQRQAVSAAGTTASLVTALSAVKAEIGAAALGFNIDGRYQCQRLNLAGVYANAPFTPLRVERTADSAFDTLHIHFATQLSAAAPVRLAELANPNSTTLQLRSWLPASAGQGVMIAPDEPGEACTVRTVSSITAPALPGLPWNVTLQSATSFTAPTQYLPNATVSLVGEIEQRTIGVTQGQLELTSSLLGGSAALADNVVAFRVQYGVTDAGGGISWLDPTGAWSALDATNAARVRALRMGIVARAPQRDKQCDASTDAPALFGEAIALSGDWSCYRYRQAEVVVPLRNVAWMGAPA